MLELDGRAGGGQLVRTALSLSALSGRAFRLTDIRESRPNPGLRPQHLAAVRVLAEMTDAGRPDLEPGDTTVVFEPGALRPGSYEVDVGTAGSLTLLFDAVLPLATELDGQLTLSARGGTDVGWSPPMDFFRRVKLPLLRRHGLAAAVDVDARGFYPTGGGRATLSIAPSMPGPLELEPPAGPGSARVYSAASGDLADREVAERQATSVTDGLDVDVTERVVEYAESASPGSVLTVRLDRGRAIAGVDALGEPGKPAEVVGEEALEQANDLFAGSAAVDHHLADQLLVFLGVARGRVAVPAVTDHVAASLPLLRRFGFDLQVDRTGRSPVLRA